MVTVAEIQWHWYTTKMLDCDVNSIVRIRICGVGQGENGRRRQKPRHVQRGEIVIVCVVVGVTKTGAANTANTVKCRLIVVAHQRGRCQRGSERRRLGHGGHHATLRLETARRRCEYLCRRSDQWQRKGGSHETCRRVCRTGHDHGHAGQTPMRRRGLHD